jgi:polyisoprenoid-binding protein YceI
VTFLFIDDDVDGTLSGFDFTGKIDLGDPGNSVFSGSVEMETLDTNNWFRNRHLRSKKYFNNKEFPKLFFKSNSVTASGNEFVVRGDLTIKGISKPVSFTFTRLPGKLRGTTVINASDFDIFIHNEPERNMVNVTLTLPYSLD